MDDLEFGLDLLFGRYPPDHQGWVELRAIPKDRQYKVVIAHCPWDENAVAYVSDWHDHLVGSGKPIYNFYVGRNLRDTKDGSSKQDIGFVNALSFDIDCMRADPAYPATDEELQKALPEAEKAQKVIGCGSILMSGNGYQVWVPLSEPVDTAGRIEFLEQGHASIERRILEAIDPSKVKLDPQHDLPRVVKLPGSTATKAILPPINPISGSLSHYRVAKWETRNGDCLRSSDFLEICKRALAESKKPTTEISRVGVPARFWKLMEYDDKVKSNYLGTSASPSQSERDMSLVSFLFRKGYSAEEAAAILRSSPASKAKEREDYINLTIQKVFNGK